MSIDPQNINLAVKGANHIKNGYKNFAGWRQIMIEEFGDEIKPFLLIIWSQAKDIVKQQESEERNRLVQEIINKYDDSIDTKSTQVKEKEKKEDFQVSNVNKKFYNRNRLIEITLFVGGTFIFVICLTGGYYNRGGTDFFGIHSSSSGFRLWSIIGMAIGICMIVYGILRRTWKDKRKNKFRIVYSVLSGNSLIKFNAKVYPSIVKNKCFLKKSGRYSFFICSSLISSSLSKSLK